MLWRIYNWAQRYCIFSCCVFNLFIAVISAEDPSGNLYHFDGSIEISLPDGTSTRFPLSVNQLALRGSTLVNSGSVTGVVVYTGEESKIRQNANEKHISKKPLMEKFTNTIVIVLFCLILLLAALSTILSYAWERDVNQFGKRHWYLDGLKPDFAATYFSYGMYSKCL